MDRSRNHKGGGGQFSTLHSSPPKTVWLKMVVHYFWQFCGLAGWWFYFMTLGEV